jgi:hypothetical protein
VNLDEVDPHLVRAIQYLFDGYGPAGVANVVAMMRGELYGPPAPTTDDFTERRQHAAERQLTLDLADANPPGWPYPEMSPPDS